MKIKNILYAFAAILILSCSKDDEATLSPAQFSIDQSTIDFGELKTSMQRSIKVTVTNTGEQTLILNSFTFSGTNASEFLINEAEKTIEADKTHEFWVGFRPIEAGDKTAILTITSNIGEHKIDLSGKAILNPNDIVSIPDANFKASLLAHGTTITGGSISKIDINDDGEIQISEAEAYKEAINCNDKSISDLTGIEAFVNLTELIATQNQLTLLDVSNNTALVKLNVDNNLLTSLDISKNIGLEVLRCTDNQLTGLDVSQNVNLNSITCNNNKLTTLDISKNTLLGNLYCFNNQITSLDISHNTGLRILNCSNNKLTALNVANGNNHNMIFMSALYNSMTCIQIDEGFTPHSDWRKDGTASYSTSCL